MVLAVLLAFGAAASFAAGSALQHRVAGATAADRETRGAFVVRLVHQPSWLVGLLLSAVAFALHAAALSQGQLALVQPIIVSGIVFAVVIRSALARRWPPPSTLGWLLLTWAGLALFLAVRPEGADHAPNHGLAIASMVVGVLLAVALLVAARVAGGDRRRGVLIAAAAGTLFGLVAGDVKLIFAQLHADAGGLLTAWPTWVLPLVGLAAVILNQRAYQSAHLSVTTPVLNIAQAAVAIVIGLLVFADGADSSTAELVGQAVGFALVIIGVVKLTTSPETTGAPSPSTAGENRGSRSD